LMVEALMALAARSPTRRAASGRPDPARTVIINVQGDPALP